MLSAGTGEAGGGWLWMFTQQEAKIPEGISQVFLDLHIFAQLVLFFFFPLYRKIYFNSVIWTPEKLHGCMLGCLQTVGGI